MNPDSHSSPESSLEAGQVDTGQPAPNRKSVPTHSFWRYAQYVLFSSMIVLGLYLWWIRLAPDPPHVELADRDPAIVRILRNCERAVQRYPRSGTAWGQLGVALLVYDFKSQAQQCFQQAERFSAKEPRWPYFHALSLLPDEPAQALQKLQHAVQLYQDESSAPRLRLASLLAELEQYAEAEEHYQTVLQKWPDDPGALIGMGRLAYERGEFAESVEYLKKAKDSPYVARAAHQLLAKTYAELDQPAMVAATRQKLRQLPADRQLPDPFIKEASALRAGLRAWVDYARLLVRQGRIQEAKPVAERAVEDYPESSEAWILMARIHLAERAREKAISAAKKAVELAPEAVQSHVQLGIAQLFNQQIDAAIDSFKTAVELNPESTESYHNLGLCYAAKKDWQEAIAAFRKATQRNPGFVDSYLGLADALARIGDRADAQKAIERALQLRPQDPRVHQLISKHGFDFDE